MVDRPRGHHTGTDCKGCNGTNNFSNAAAAAAATAEPAATIQSVNKSAAARPAATSTAAAASTRAAAATAAAAEVTTTATAATSAKQPGGPGTFAADLCGPGPAAPATFNLPVPWQLLRSGKRSGAARQYLSHVDLRRERSTCHNGLIATGCRMHTEYRQLQTATPRLRGRRRALNIAVAGLHQLPRPGHATGNLLGTCNPLACATCHSTTA
jgi:hypothetical protein